MDYIYDIVLNFQKDYHDFYEWKSTDKIINVKKIPVYLVNDKDYLDLKYNEVIIDNTNKDITTKMFLVTNGLEVMGILLDNYGKIHKKSSLLLDEADEVLEEKETIKALPLKYKRNILKSHNFNSRIKIDKTRYLQSYLSNIDINKDEYLLRYIYFEIFNKEEKDIIIVYKELKKLIDENLDKIYNSIKKVNLELKQ